MNDEDAKNVNAGTKAERQETKFEKDDLVCLKSGEDIGDFYTAKVDEIKDDKVVVTWESRYGGRTRRKEVTKDKLKKYEEEDGEED